MSKLSLFDLVPEKPKSITLVMEESDAMQIEYETIVRDNPNLKPTESLEDDLVEAGSVEDALDDIDGSFTTIQDGTVAVGALNDTAVHIAPLIREATKRDYALVRQVATTAAAGMGMSPQEILGEKFHEDVGQPMSLQMEGFKSQATAAVKALLTFIANVFDYVFTAITGVFKRIGPKMKILQGNVKTLYQLKAADTVTELMKPGRMWFLLTTDGSLPTDTAVMADAMLSANYNADLIQTLHVGADFNILRMDELAKQSVGYSEFVSTLVRSLSRLLTAAKKDAKVFGDRPMGNDLNGMRSIGGGYVSIKNGMHADAWMNMPADKALVEISRVSANWEAGRERFTGDVYTQPVNNVLNVATVFMVFLNEKFTPESLAAVARDARTKERYLRDWADRFLSNSVEGEQKALPVELLTALRTQIQLSTGIWPRFCNDIVNMLDAMNEYTSQTIAIYKKQ